MGLEQSTNRTQGFCFPTTSTFNPCLARTDSNLGHGRNETLVFDNNPPPHQNNRINNGQSIADGVLSRNLGITKNIFVLTKDGGTIRIQFDTSEQDNLTCGWLVSETIRQFTDLGLSDVNSMGTIVTLQTADGIITLDYWLSELERSVSVLKDGTVLKPFYGDPKYTITDQKVSLEYFQILKLLGTGGSSKVYLARRKDNGRFYAIKVMSKKEIVMRDKEETLFNERNTMVRLHHPLLTKLHFAFQTDSHLFLVMDFYPGGELFYHLSKRRKPLTEEQAKVYMGEIILALNYLHKNNIIYRDLKPENILVDLDGHLHLTDFGLCKTLEHKDELTYTFCGSPEYMAPEVIQGTGYNYTVDFYSLGMLIYEMVVGRSPFIWKTEKDLFKQILQGEIHFPNSMSKKLKSFLSQLLAKDPKERLGAKKGLPEIVNHPWCANLDFVSIASKKGKVPIVPNIYETNFDKEFITAKVSLVTDPLSDPELVIQDNFPTKSLATRGITMFARFANFSFYSNIEDPYEKYQDSIFLPNDDDTPRNPEKVTPFTYRYKNNDFTDTFLKDDRAGDQETNEDSKQFDRSSFLHGEPYLRNFSGNYATISLGLNPIASSRFDSSMRHIRPSLQVPRPFPEDLDLNRRKSAMNPIIRGKTFPKPVTYVSDTIGIRPEATQVPSKNLALNETAPLRTQQHRETQPVQKTSDVVTGEILLKKRSDISGNASKHRYSQMAPHTRKDSISSQAKEALNMQKSSTFTQIKFDQKKVNLYFANDTTAKLLPQESGYQAGKKGRK